jgi:hypothetical protein
MRSIGGELRELAQSQNWSNREALALMVYNNHPNGQLVTFAESGHSIFNEESEAFFSTLRDFVHTLSPIEAEAMGAYQRELGSWREALKEPFQRIENRER